MTRFLFSIALASFLSVGGFASESSSESELWEQKYEQLLKDRPDIRSKVERGGATKEEVIAWMKKGGDAWRKPPRGRYYGWKVAIKDPTEFQKNQETAIYSGPQPGELLPALKVTGLRGRQKGEEFDPVDVADSKPLVLIFQDDSVVGQKGLLLCGAPLARIAENSPHGLRVSATFLVDDPTPGGIFRYDFMEEIDDVIEMSVSADRRDGPEAYGLNRNVAMTVIVARGGKVLHNFAFPQPMLYPDPHVIGAIAEAIEVDHETLKAWLASDKRDRARHVRDSE